MVAVVVVVVVVVVAVAAAAAVAVVAVVVVAVLLLFRSTLRWSQLTMVFLLITVAAAAAAAAAAVLLALLPADAPLVPTCENRSKFAANGYTKSNRTGYCSKNHSESWVTANLDARQAALKPSTGTWTGHKQS